MQSSAGPPPTDSRPDLVVLSHLPWAWVWQRPQHLISRLAPGRRVWFVERPVERDVATARLGLKPAGPVCRVRLELPRFSLARDFNEPGAEMYGELLVDVLGAAGTGSDVWLYAPTALAMGEALRPRLLAYDFMDDLSAFVGSDDDVRALQSAALRRADVVFCGGRSLFRAAVAERGKRDTHLFPSGVDFAHFAEPRRSRSGSRPVAGFVGVLDERFDLDLLAGIARELPDWDIRLIGPVAKIDQTAVPQAENLHYDGMRSYQELPQLMAALDVALMPFALNRYTRSISPTKTLEYLAAGLPVVSTRVPDVVADWSGHVRLEDDAPGFARACRELYGQSTHEQQLAPLRDRFGWDTTSRAMERLMADKVAGRAASPRARPGFETAPEGSAS